MRYDGGGAATGGGGGGRSGRDGCGGPEKLSSTSLSDMAGFRGNAKQLRRRSDSRCSWRRIANHSRLSAAAASDSASCSIMSGKRGATWRREPTYPGEDRRSAADPDRWDDLGESNENAIDWFARARCSTTWRGGGNSSGRPSAFKVLVYAIPNCSPTPPLPTPPRFARLLPSVNS